MLEGPGKSHLCMTKSVYASSWMSLANHTRVQMLRSLAGRSQPPQFEHAYHHISVRKPVLIVLTWSGLHQVLFLQHDHDDFGSGSCFNSGPHPTQAEWAHLIQYYQAAVLPPRHAVFWE
jgi:hypothetical protein